MMDPETGRFREGHQKLGGRVCSSIITNSCLWYHRNRCVRSCVCTRRPCMEDLMTHPDVLHLLDTVGHGGFVDEDGRTVGGDPPNRQALRRRCSVTASIGGGLKCPPAPARSPFDAEFCPESGAKLRARLPQCGEGLRHPPGEACARFPDPTRCYNGGR